MLMHNAKTQAGPKTGKPGSTGDLNKVPKGPQDSVAQTAENQAKLKGKSAAEILYPSQPRP